MHKNHLKIWTNADCDSIGIEWQLRFCASNKLSSGANAAGSQTTRASVNFIPRSSEVKIAMEESGAT